MQHATANAVHRPFNTFPYNRKCLETSNRILKSRVSAKRIQAVCHKHGSVLFRNARAPAVFHAKHRLRKTAPRQVLDKDAISCCFRHVVPPKANGKHGHNAQRRHRHQHYHTMQRFLLPPADFGACVCLFFLSPHLYKINGVKNQQDRQRHPSKTKLFFHRFPLLSLYFLFKSFSTPAPSG